MHLHSITSLFFIEDKDHSNSVCMLQQLVITVLMASYARVTI